jgi:hypothetical protein
MYWIDADVFMEDIQMGEYEITFVTDGKEISQEEIYSVERQRYQIVFHELVNKGIPMEYKGKRYSPEELEELDLKDAREVLAETKEKLGRERIRELYAEELAEGDKLLKEISADSKAKENLQPGIVEVKTKGISIEQFLMVNRLLAKKNSLEMPSKMHPEHYSFEAGPGGTQIIIERFGMYKYPAYLYLEPDKSGYRPIPLDEDTSFAMTGCTRLMSDRTDTKIIGMHQFKKCSEGMDVKLGVFLPEAAPKEMLEGHKWHLMVEFNNCMHLAAEMKPNILQKAAMDMALKRIQKQQQKSGLA